MSRTPKKFRGRWRITDMSGWSPAERDEFGPAVISFSSGGQGDLRFIAVEGELDCRFAGNRVEFCWMGYDDTSPSAGRGWAEIGDDGKLRGMIYIHYGDDSDFEAERQIG